MQCYLSVLLLVLATTCSVQSQMLGDPGTEPWAMVAMPACMAKNVNIQEAQGRASGCVSALGNPQNPMAICDKQKERNNCLKPYYDTLKKCFDDDSHVKKAYEAQKEGIKYVCKDNMKQMKSLSREDMQCADKMQDPSIQSCTEKLVRKHMPDMKKLFSENNCMLMSGLLDCQMKAMKSCKTNKFSNYMKGQYEAITDDTPCDMYNGATRLILTPALLLCLLSHAFFKYLF